jgi:hypothetical protein
MIQGRRLSFYFTNCKSNGFVYGGAGVNYNEAAKSVIYKDYCSGSWRWNIAYSQYLLVVFKIKPFSGDSTFDIIQESLKIDC